MENISSYPKAKQFLSEKFYLDSNGNEQDWAVEFADPEKLERFIDYYESEKLPDNVKFALMELIFASLDELMDTRKNTDRIWSRIKNLLLLDAVLHESTIQYWEQSDNFEKFNISDYLSDL